MQNKNEIILLTSSLLFLMFISRAIVLSALWLFRIFGMPELWNWYCSLKNPGYYSFFIVLMIWMVGCICWILRRRKKIRKHDEEVEDNSHDMCEDEN